MGQLEDYWVPKPIFDEELKRRQDAERRLDEVLRYLDPRPQGGPIYAAPFPEPGDLGQSMVALAEEWGREAAGLRQGTEYADVAESMEEMAKQLRTALGEHADKGEQKPEWLHGPRLVTVYAEGGIRIEPLLVRIGAARTETEAHDLIGEGLVEIDVGREVQGSHWRGTNQEFTLYVGKSFVRRVRITSPSGAEENAD